MAASAAEYTYTGTVEVTVVAGHRLLAADANGFSDPYVKVAQVPERAGLTKKEAKGTSVKTPIVKKTLDPVWNFSASLPVVDATAIEFQAKDDDKVGHNDPLGMALLPLLDLAHGRELATSLRLVPGSHPNLPPQLGELEIKATFVSAAPIFPVYGVNIDAALDHDMELAAAHDLPQPIDGVPSFLRSLGDRILALGGTSTEGIFRVPGNAATIRLIKEAANFGDLPAVLARPSADVASVAGAFKLWFRELEAPLIPDASYDAALAIATPDDARALVASLSLSAQNVIEYLATFILGFTESPAAVDATKMDRKNMAMVFAPSLLRPTDDMRLINDSGAISEFALLVISSYAA